MKRKKLNTFKTKYKLKKKIFFMPRPRSLPCRTPCLGRRGLRDLIIEHIPCGFLDATGSCVHLGLHLDSIPPLGVLAEEKQNWNSEP